MRSRCGRTPAYPRGHDQIHLVKRLDLTPRRDVLAVLLAVAALSLAAAGVRTPSWAVATATLAVAALFQPD